MKNRYWIEDGIVYIIIPSKGAHYICTIDESDFDKVNICTWHLKHDRNTNYARGTYKGTKIYMHRLITDAKPEVIVDHEDRNGLNNTRLNLIEGTQEDNMGNSITAHKATYITYDKGKKRYRVKIKNKHIGWYKTEEEAIQGRDAFFN